MKDEVYYYKKGQDGYPKKLLSYGQAPEELQVRGRLPDPAKPSVAIVGARMCSSYGKTQAFQFARALAGQGVQIISGLAKGIDGKSHEGALAGGGATFGVLGCGVDICYPRENINLFQEMIQKGGVLSEFPLGTAPRSQHFPQRNRIISGLADVVLVVEAKARSGSLITVDFALEQGKPVFAVPGRVGDPLSDGCNRLIAQGAGIAFGPECILEALEMDPVFQAEQTTKKKLALARDLELVYSKLDLQPKNLDSIHAQVPLPLDQLLHILLALELEGLIEEPVKNYYVRIP